MGWLDKLLGRTKKATGEVVGDSSLRREGMHQKPQGMAAERAEVHEPVAQEERVEAAEPKAEAPEPKPKRSPSPRTRGSTSSRSKGSTSSRTRKKPKP